MAKSSYDPPPDIPAGRRRIIYVDDVNYSLISVKSRLSKYYEVFLAESSVKLFELLGYFKPDLILLDVNMPDIDGYDVIKSLKTDERYAQIPVVFLTGNSDRESVVKGLSLGAVDYVIKPVSTPKLVEIIDSHLEFKKYNKTSQDDVNVNKKSVLAVDDVVSMLRAIQYALHDSYKVYVLSKSEDVLDFLKTKKPDLILLDYVMPVLNGFDLINIIRSLPDHKYTPIIIITTEGTQEHVNEAISLGASDFIVKPFKSKELNDKVAKHIRIANELKKIREDNEQLYK
ncbi:MAG: response regulator [Treponema sp.]|jgi:PleD family two-component response regulator|nr:response regulator [Treponema sp.]